MPSIFKKITYFLLKSIAREKKSRIIDVQGIVGLVEEQ